MKIPDQLLDEFAKFANGEKEKKKEFNAYATVVQVDANGNVSIKFDGSDLITVCTTSVNVKKNDRVLVHIKNRKGIITSNLSSKSINVDYLEAGSAKFNGRVEAESGYFKGELRAATGSFKGIVVFDWYHYYIDPSEGAWNHVYIGDPSQEYPFIIKGPTTQVVSLIADDIPEVSVSAGPNQYAVLWPTGVITSSDRRSKEEIEDASPELAKRLRPVSYKYIGTEETRWGFIAQEVQEIIPSAVHEIGDRLSLNYTDLISPVTALLLEHEKKISRLENELDLLRKEVNRLNGEIKHNSVTTDEK